METLIDNGQQLDLTKEQAAELRDADFIIYCGDDNGETPPIFSCNAWHFTSAFLDQQCDGENFDLAFGRIDSIIAACSELRRQGWTPQLCQCCGIGPFVFIETRQNPRLCLDCAEGRHHTDGAFRCRKLTALPEALPHG